MIPYWIAFLTFCVGALLKDIWEAYTESLNPKGFFIAIVEILSDLKFWLVVAIGLFVMVFPFAWFLMAQEDIENSKWEAKIQLQDGRTFVKCKNEIYTNGNEITFTTNSGEEITTTLYTITYTKTKQTETN